MKNKMNKVMKKVLVYALVAVLFAGSALTA